MITFRLDEIEKIINKVNSMPKVPIKIKVNEKWLQEQIDNGAILQNNHNSDGGNSFFGVPVVISNDIDTYEFVYNR